MPKRGTEWIPEKVAILKRCYESDKFTIEEIVKMIGKTKNAVRLKASRTGLRRPMLPFKTCLTYGRARERKALDETQRRVNEKIDGSKWMCKAPNCTRDCDSHPCLINDWLLKQKDEADKEAMEDRLRAEGEAIAEAEEREDYKRAQAKDEEQEFLSQGQEGEPEQ